MRGTVQCPAAPDTTRADMVGELCHEETFSKLRRTDEQIGSGIQQPVNNRRLALEDALIQLLHRDRCEKGRIEHSQNLHLHLRKSFVRHLAILRGF